MTDSTHCVVIGDTWPGARVAAAPATTSRSSKFSGFRDRGFGVGAGTSGGVADGGHSMGVGLGILASEGECGTAGRGKTTEGDARDGRSSSSRVYVNVESHIAAMVKLSAFQNYVD